MNKNEIIERLGAQNWRMVKKEYKGKTKKQIRESLTYMWPHETKANRELAQAIHTSLN